jgi:hypothetical protein
MKAVGVVCCGCFFVLPVDQSNIQERLRDRGLQDGLCGFRLLPFQVEEYA